MWRRSSELIEDRARWEVELLVGSGGGVDVGSGLIHQASAGLSWPCVYGSRLGLDAGSVDTLGDGPFEALVIGVHLGFGVQRALAREE